MSSVKAKIATSCMVYVDSDSTAAGLYLPKTLHEDIRKTLGGSGETTVVASGNTVSVFGYVNGSPTYIRATSGGTSIGITGNGSADYTIFIKHTGYAWSSSSVLGSSSTDNMDIVITNADGSTAICTMTLSAGQAVVFPDTLLAGGCKILAKRGSSTDLACEVMYVPTI